MRYTYYDFNETRCYDHFMNKPKLGRGNLKLFLAVVHAGSRATADQRNKTNIIIGTDIGPLLEVSRSSRSSLALRQRYNDFSVSVSLLKIADCIGYLLKGKVSVNHGIQVTGFNPLAHRFQIRLIKSR